MIASLSCPSDISTSLKQAELNFFDALQAGDFALQSFADHLADLRCKADTSLEGVDEDALTSAFKSSSNIALVASGFLQIESEAECTNAALQDDLAAILADLEIEDSLTDSHQHSSSNTRCSQTRVSRGPVARSDAKFSTLNSCTGSHHHHVVSKWLLENIHNPFPSSSARDRLAMQSGASPQTIREWFVRARKRVGWTDIITRLFNGIRGDALGAAHDVFIESDMSYNPGRDSAYDCDSNGEEVDGGSHSHSHSPYRYQHAYKYPQEVVAAFHAVRAAAEKLYGTSSSSSSSNDSASKAHGGQQSALATRLASAMAPARNPGVAGQKKRKRPSPPGTDGEPARKTRVTKNARRASGASSASFASSATLFHDSSDLDCPGASESESPARPLSPSSLYPPECAKASRKRGASASIEEESASEAAGGTDSARAVEQQQQKQRRIKRRRASTSSSVSREPTLLRSGSGWTTSTSGVSTPAPMTPILAPYERELDPYAEFGIGFGLDHDHDRAQAQTYGLLSGAAEATNLTTRTNTTASSETQTSLASLIDDWLAAINASARVAVAAAEAESSAGKKRRSRGDDEEEEEEDSRRCAKRARVVSDSQASESEGSCYPTTPPESNPSFAFPMAEKENVVADDALYAQTETLDFMPSAGVDELLFSDAPFVGEKSGDVFGGTSTSTSTTTGEWEMGGETGTPFEVGPGLYGYGRAFGGEGGLGLDYGSLFGELETGTAGMCAAGAGTGAGLTSVLELLYPELASYGAPAYTAGGEESRSVEGFRVAAEGNPAADFEPQSQGTMEDGQLELEREKKTRLELSRLLAEMDNTVFSSSEC